MYILPFNRCMSVYQLLVVIINIQLAVEKLITPLYYACFMETVAWWEWATVN